jgi:MoaA/NifB/PqqE/SkfB family radical SAM enzyme
VVRLAAELGAETTVEPPLLGAAPEPRGDVSRKLLDLRRRHPALRSRSGYLARIDEALGVVAGGCRAGRRTLHIDQRGRVSRCPEFRSAADQAGDLRSDDVRDVLERLRGLAAEDGCRRCWRPFRGELERLESLWGVLSALPTLVRR